MYMFPRSYMDLITVSALLIRAISAQQTPFSLDSDDAIRASAKTLAYDLMKFYHGNESGQIPGILPGPPPAGDYYWWEGGALWGAMIDYWHYTGDTTYNDVVTQALLHQVGPDADYMPPNYTASLGNDDQGFWGMSAMQAAEENFPDPPADQPQWLALAQAVFNTQADPSRHDDTCGGGLRWQIPLSNNGYDYKNSIANGCFFNLGARLARYLDNGTYAAWAEQTWDWVRGVGFIDDDYNIYDGGHVRYNCTDINRAQFSYNNAVYLLGAAHMYNYTSSSSTGSSNDGTGNSSVATAAVWADRVRGLVNGTLRVFFPDGVAVEASCEQRQSCTTDMLSFKGYDHRWLTQTAQLAPFVADQVLPVLQTSARAAAGQCMGGADGRTCGFMWASGQYDGTTGAGQTMNVLGAVSALLHPLARAPVTNTTGGTSVGDPNAGQGSGQLLPHYAPITAADRAGAGILTALLIAWAIGTWAWISVGY
ncbi:hypothetical protein SLS62_006153 [Diatrype stigma]|uniref:Mannan endo-1,6-alpha-mannosidase n=1 Tax=Diatrype stigma TaxID=117547 RepID=A0AAN9UR54_9PEZI